MKILWKRKKSDVTFQKKRLDSHQERAIPSCKDTNYCFQQNWRPLRSPKTGRGPRLLSDSFGPQDYHRAGEIFHRHLGLSCSRYTELGTHTVHTSIPIESSQTKRLIMIIGNDYQPHCRLRLTSASTKQMSNAASRGKSSWTARYSPLGQITLGNWKIRGWLNSRWVWPESQVRNTTGMLSSRMTGRNWCSLSNGANSSSGFTSTPHTGQTRLYPSPPRWCRQEAYKSFNMFNK